jgi:hypothetical protein
MLQSIESVRKGGDLTVRRYLALDRVYEGVQSADLLIGGDQHIDTCHRRCGAWGPKAPCKPPNTVIPIHGAKLGENKIAIFLIKNSTVFDTSVLPLWFLSLASMPCEVGPHSMMGVFYSTSTFSRNCITFSMYALRQGLGPCFGAEFLESLSTAHKTRSRSAFPEFQSVTKGEDCPFRGFDESGQDCRAAAITRSSSLRLAPVAA